MSFSSPCIFQLQRQHHVQKTESSSEPATKEQRILRSSSAFGHQISLLALHMYFQKYASFAVLPNILPTTIKRDSLRQNFFPCFP